MAQGVLAQRSSTKNGIDLENIDTEMVKYSLQKNSIFNRNILNHPKHKPKKRLNSKKIQLFRRK